MRSLLIILTIAVLAMQGRLWFAEDGFRKTRQLRETVDTQRAQNEVQRERNQSLEAEVLNLKEGRDAAEERARTDLGMIGKNETFFQVIPAGGPRIVANADDP